MPSLPPPVPKLPDHLVNGALVLPSRDALVRLFPKRQVLAEIGVGLGYFSHLAFELADPAHFIAIDDFRLDTLPSVWGRTPAEHFGDMTHLDWYRHEFAREIATGRMDVLRGNSAAMLETLPDKSIDIAYVDADHGQDAVQRDLAVLVRKIRPDGWIMMDDYTLVDQLETPHVIGVIYATHAFMIEHNWAMHYLALQPNGYYQVMLRRADHTRPAGAEAALLRASTSWRMTAPLRALKEASSSFLKKRTKKLLPIESARA